MIHATEIELEYSEGPVTVMGVITVTGYRIWDQAEDLLSRWANTSPGAPGRPEMGYDFDNTFYKVTYGDGIRFANYYHLAYQRMSQDAPTLVENARLFVELHKMDVDRTVATFYQRWAETYRIGEVAEIETSKPPANIMEVAGGFAIDCVFCGTGNPGEDENITRGLAPHNEGHRRVSPEGRTYYVAYGAPL